MTYSRKAWLCRDFAVEKKRLKQGLWQQRNFLRTQGVLQAGAPNLEPNGNGLQTSKEIRMLGVQVWCSGDCHE